MQLLIYWVPIAVTAVAAVLAMWLPHRRPDWPWRTVGVVLAFLLAVCEASWWVDLLASRPFDAAVDLPLQLCDITAWVAAAALVFRRDVLYQLTYLWGVGGGIPALFLPVRGQPFPGWFYFEFYLAHGALVVAGLLSVVAFGTRFRPATAIRAMVVTGVVALCMGIVDILSGGDYLYLASLPPVTGPVQVLSTWPWYRPAFCFVAALGVAFLAWLARSRDADVSAVAAPTHTG